MINSGITSKQCARLAWTRERLLCEHALAMGQAIDTSTWKSYSSALNSYLTFVRMHDFPVEPTADTLSFFTVYMCHHIKPSSVDNYLLQFSFLVPFLSPFVPLHFSIFSLNFLLFHLHSLTVHT